MTGSEPACTSGGGEPNVAGDTPRPRRFVGRKTAAAAAEAAGGGAVSQEVVPAAAAAAPAGPKRFTRQQVPDEILNNPLLATAMSVLPKNYNFEIHKTIWRLKKAGAKRVALQFPEGLLMYSCVIADIIERFADVEHTFIMGDVAYGACCIDDFSARALQADFMVHYGHSCLVPVDQTGLPCMYVFVDISIDVEHLVESVRLNFKPDQRIVLAGTIQFASGMQAAREQLAAQLPGLEVPQCKPLSPGEVLGCTAPVISDGADVIVFVADGRFHLEAIMIANPDIPAYRYDPYARKLTLEKYDQEGMRAVRRSFVTRARSAKRWGLILSTLGRQGNPRILDTMKAVLEKKGMPYTVFLVSELSPAKLDALGPDTDAYVQIACPRLSIDWGEGFKKPTLTPYEALVALGEVPEWWDDGAGVKKDGSMAPYPMDYYSKDGGEWNSTYHRGAVATSARRSNRERIAARRAAAAAHSEKAC